MTLAAASDLAGTLRVRPGGALPTLQSDRREWAPRLGRGLPAAQWPARASLVFAGCGAAHRIAATHAVRAAGATGLAPADPAADTAALRADTLREHVRRLWLDAPSTLPAVAGPDAAALAACPVLRDARALDDSQGWFRDHVFHQPVADWLHGWQADPEGHARRWAAAGASWPARWLAAVRRTLGDRRQRLRALAPHGAPDELRALGATLRDDPAQALSPTWQGRTAETGCWTRLADPLRTADPAPYEPLWMRHAARIADMAQLLSPGGAHWLAQGGLALDDGEGLGWCEMARGLLLHGVRIGADGRLTGCRLIAPTEWNFHPCGSAARALAALPAQAAAAVAPLLVAAYDPCVTVHIDSPVEAGHA